MAYSPYHIMVSLRSMLLGDWGGQALTRSSTGGTPVDTAQLPEDGLDKYRIFRGAPPKRAS